LKVSKRPKKKLCNTHKGERFRKGQAAEGGNPAKSRKGEGTLKGIQKESSPENAEGKSGEAKRQQGAREGPTPGDGSMETSPGWGERRGKESLGKAGAGKLAEKGRKCRGRIAGKRGSRSRKKYRREQERILIERTSGVWLSAWKTLEETMD